MLGSQPAAGNPFFMYSNLFIELRLRALLCSKWTFRREGAGVAQDKAWCWSASVFWWASLARGPATLVTLDVKEVLLRRWSELPARD